MSELEAFVAEESETVEMTAESPDEVETESTPDIDSQGETAEPPAAEPQPEAPPEPTMVPLAAKQAEKDRRIRAEQELQRLQQASQKQEEPDPYVQPKEAIQHATQQVRNEMMSMFRNMSEANARKTHDDYDSKFETFTNMVQSQPILLQQLANELDPGEFVYQTAAKHLEMQEIGDIGSYKERLREELKAELMAELKPANTTSVPPDLTNARSAGGDPVDAIADGDDGLEQLLGR